MILRFLHYLLWFSGFGLCLLGYALLIEPSRLVVRQVEFVSAKYEGPDIRIGLVTDIHINSAHVPPRRVAEIVSRLNEQDLDFILMPGDFVAGHDRSEKRSETFNRNIALGLAHFSKLNAPTYATIGNHDAWWDAARVTAHLQGAGVEVLDNQTANFDGLCIVGLGDYWTGSPDRTAYSGCAQNSSILVFTHSPDAWTSFRSDTVLALAGHTHGGQVNLPIFGRRVNAIELGPEHSYGFSRIGGVDLFVSAGIGTSMLPIRFRAPPEIIILTLTSAHRGRSPHHSKVDSTLVSPSGGSKIFQYSPTPS